jgi:hypothetical protein
LTTNATNAMGFLRLTMMTMVAMTTTTTGGTAKMPNGVGDKFEAPLERDKAEFGPLGVAASPPLGIGISRG